MPPFYRGKIYSSHLFVGLNDAEELDDHLTRWEEGQLLTVGPRGVGIATAEGYITILLYTAPARLRSYFAGKVQIEVGRFGLELGAVLDMELIAWPAGPLWVSVYLNATDPFEITRVSLVLEPVNGQLPPDLYVQSEAKTIARLNELLNQFKDDDSHLRMFATVTLGKLGPIAVEPLLAALAEPHPGVRMMAASALRFLRDPRAIEPLVQALGDSDPQVQIQAADALGWFRDPRAADGLNAMLQKLPSPEVIARTHGPNSDLMHLHRVVLMSLEKHKRTDIQFL